MKFALVFLLALATANATSDQQLKRLNALLPLLEKDSGERGPIECLACKTLVQWLLDLIEDNFGPDEIIQELLNFCATTAWPETCSNFVNDHISDIIDSVWGHRPTPEELCKNLQFCN